jgi:hypothetical protein
LLSFAPFSKFQNNFGNRVHLRLFQILFLCAKCSLILLVSYQRYLLRL